LTSARELPHYEERGNLFAIPLKKLKLEVLSPTPLLTGLDYTSSATRYRTVPLYGTIVLAYRTELKANPSPSKENTEKNL
jgi:hypothetical protein